MKTTRPLCATALFVSAAFLNGAELPVNPFKTPAGVSDSDWSGIRAAYEQSRHAVVVSADGSHQARNPGQAWVTRFDGHAFTVSPDNGGWTWGLELKSYGYAGRELDLPGSPDVKTEGGKLEYQHDGNLSEWFVNDSRGLEQGWTLSHRPAGAEDGKPLKLEISLHGGLEARVAGGGAAVSFVDSNGVNVIQYSSLKAWDADGKSVPVNFEPGENGFQIVAEDVDARYPVTIDPLAQQAYFKASNAEAGDGFGTSVALSGDTAVVAALGENSKSMGVNGDQNNPGLFYAGAAYVFVRKDGVWSQQAYLKASNTEASDYFGKSVAISGDTILVGAPSESSSATGVNGDQSDNNAYRAGAAYVFARNGTTWSQQAYLKASNTRNSNGFGGSVSVSGDLLVVGASSESSPSVGVNGSQVQSPSSIPPERGAAYIFARSGTIWSQQAYLKASNTGKSDYFGYSVAIDGEMVVVGAPYQGSSGNGGPAEVLDGSGAAYVFSKTAGTWSQQAYLKASNPDSIDLFGISVAASGETVVVGASGEGSAAKGINGEGTDNSKPQSGAAYVFVRNEGSWSQQAYLKASNTDTGDSFGWSVSVSGDKLVVGARGESSNATGADGNQADNSMSSSGAVYLYGRAGNVWSQQSYFKASNTNAADNFGFSVAISGGTMVVGGPGESSNSVGMGGIQTDNSASGSGAVYAFETTYTLSASPTPHGTVNGGGTFFAGSQAAITASADPGYTFSNWSGALSGSDVMPSVLMDADKEIGANFVPDSRDPDGDGLDNYTEIVVSGTDPNVADTDGDGYSDGYERQFSSDPKDVASVPQYALTLVNQGSAPGGSFLKSGSLAHGKNALVTAAPQPGYMFGKWTNDSTSRDNPLTLLMDSNKTIGATFEHDTRDPDGDGLDNYTEIVVLGTDPNKADTDRDGVADGVEVAAHTSPLNADTDGDGLNDGIEKAIGTNPLLKDSNNNGISDADEDLDGDGVDNGLEIQLGTNPKKADSDGDGLTDGFETAYVGTTAPFTPRIGDKLRLDFQRLDFPVGTTVVMTGKLPPGLRFDPVTKRLQGRLIGQPGTYKPRLQLFKGRTYVRSIAIPFKVDAFPKGLAGSYEGLLETRDGAAVGLVDVKIKAPGKGPLAEPTWTAALDVPGSAKALMASGPVTLDPVKGSTELDISFPVARGEGSMAIGLQVDARSPLVEGMYAVRSLRSSGLIRGFRLAQKGPAGGEFNMIIDQGESDGFLIPAGLGWATGSIAPSGKISITGQLGDAQSFTTSAKLSVTGQAIVWVKPYRNLNSSLGGIISVRENGMAPANTVEYQMPGLSWVRARDASELSYPGGFGPIHAESGIRAYSVPASAAAFSKSLGLKKDAFGSVLIAGGGLPDPKGKASLPKAFFLRNNFSLVAQPLAGGTQVPWEGSVAKEQGTFSGTLDLPASPFGITGGKAAVSGIFTPGASFEGGVVGAGLVKIPVKGEMGAYRTAAVIISR